MDGFKIETVNNGWMVSAYENFTGCQRDTYVFTNKRKLGEWVTENVGDALDKRVVKKS